MKTKHKSPKNNVELLIKKAFTDKSFSYDLLELNRLETTAVYCLSCLGSFYADESEYLQKISKVLDRVNLIDTCISDLPEGIKLLFPKDMASIAKLRKAILDNSSKLQANDERNFDDSPLLAANSIILKEILASKIHFSEYQVSRNISKMLSNEVRNQDSIIGSQQLKLHEAILRLVNDAAEENKNLVPSLSDAIAELNFSFEKTKKQFLSKIDKEQKVLIKIEPHLKAIMKCLKDLYDKTYKVSSDLSLINENLTSLIEDDDLKKKKETLRLLQKYDSVLIDPVLDENNKFEKGAEFAKECFDVTYQYYIDDDGIADGGILSKAVNKLEEVIKELQNQKKDKIGS